MLLKVHLSAFGIVSDIIVTLHDIQYDDIPNLHAGYTVLLRLIRAFN